MPLLLSHNLIAVIINYFYEKATTHLHLLCGGFFVLILLFSSFFFRFGQPGKVFALTTSGTRVIVGTAGKMREQLLQFYCFYYFYFFGRGLDK